MFSRLIQVNETCDVRTVRHEAIGNVLVECSRDFLQSCPLNGLILIIATDLAGLRIEILANNDLALDYFCMALNVQIFLCQATIVVTMDACAIF
jgi:hypothetical protein